MNSSLGSTDSSLIVRAERHDAEAWDSLVDLYGPWIYGWTRRLGLSAEDGADAMQETLLAIHCSLQQFRAGDQKSNFRGWLWTVLRNKVLDQQRRHAAQKMALGGAVDHARATQVPNQLPDETRDPAAVSERAALLARGLAQVRGEFEPRTWQAFWLVTVDGHSPAEAAARVGVSAAAVRQAKCRVLRRLREQLDETGDHSS